MTTLEITAINQFLRTILITALLPAISFSASSDRDYETQGELPPHIQPTPSPPVPPQEALQSFELVDGFDLDLIVAEPLIEDPVLMEWDLQGRLWVCEMRGFMMDIDATDELAEVGRIAVLEDTNGDRKLDKVTYFLEGLVLPRAMRIYKEGVLVGDHEELWFYPDENNDLVPDDKILVDADFASFGSVEHRPNGLLIGLDNWIYNARSEKRYKRVDGEWIIEATELRGQWGISQDDYGRLYYNFHWSQLLADSAPPNTLLKNPNFSATLAANITVTNDQRVYPIRMNTGVNRGYRPGVLDNEGKLVRFGSACSPWIYRGGAFPSTFQGNAFVCGPAANVIKRNLITDRGLTVKSIPAYPDKEFLASTDERFRPVSFSGGPDGALYVVDMYRGIIQQADFITTYLRKDSLNRGMELPIHYGRIYRIQSTNAEAITVPDFLSLSPIHWVDLLTHTNGWIRDKAQQWLVWKNPEEAVEPLQALTQSADARTAIHALWTLEGMNRDLFELALKLISHPHSKLSIAARTLAAKQASNDSRTSKLITKLKSQFPENEPLSFHSLIALGQVGKAGETELAKNIATLHIESPHIREAILSNLPNQESKFLNTLLHDSGWETHSPGKQLLIQDLAASSLRSKEPIAIAHLFQLASGSNWKNKAIKEGLLTALLERESPLSFSKKPRVDDLRFLPHLQWPGHDPVSNRKTEAKQLTSEEREAYVKGKAIYGSLCASCHGPDGEGIKFLAPPLAMSEWVSGDPTILGKILLHGIEGDIEVNGKTYAPPEILPAMPPVAMMSDTEIAATLTYIRRAWGHDADPVARRDITIVRDTNMSQLQAWTVEELRDSD